MEGAMKRLTGLILMLLLALPAAAAAQDVSIKAFHGVWRGNALSESNISVHFRVTARDLDVEIRPYAQGGFSVRWATVLRQKGDPDAPVEVLKETTVDFIPDPNRPGVWRTVGSPDPLALEPLYWARLEGQTLTVYSFGIAEDGTSELQIYERTLGGLGMELEFRRTVDGQAIRSARGRLIKFAE
jgi:hypothetical protein